MDAVATVVSDTEEWTATYPNGIKIANIAVALFLLFVAGYQLAVPGMRSWLSISAESLVALVLLLLPFRARTIVSSSGLTAIRFWGKKSLSREEVQRISVGPFGPVVHTFHGERLFLTTRVPEGSWLAEVVQSKWSR